MRAGKNLVMVRGVFSADGAEEPSAKELQHSDGKSAREEKAAQGFSV
jgi:hypothetical protein